MITFKTLQSMFAREIGELDYTALTQTHKDILNDAIRAIASRHPFGCFRATDDLTLATNEATCPTDMDYSQLEHNKLYSYSGTSKTEYVLVALDEVSSYGTDSYVYAIDSETGKIKSNQNGAVKYEYQVVPADLSTLADTLKLPIPGTVVATASNIFWNGVEGEERRAEKALEKSEEYLKRSIYQDIKTKPPVTISHFLQDYDLGY